MKNTINELNFTAFSQDIVMKNKRAKIKGGVVLLRAIVKNLNVKHDLNSTLLNGKDTSEWVDESIPLNEDIFISGKKSFRHVSSNKKISADFINGHTPETMITLESDQYIPEFVQFSKIHVKSNVPVEGKVNGKNLKEEWENTVLVRSLVKIVSIFLTLLIFFSLLGIWKSDSKRRGYLQGRFGYRWRRIHPFS